MPRSKASTAKRAATRVRPARYDGPVFDVFFTLMPLELQMRIITLACRSPPDTESKEAVERRGRTHLDMATTLSICLASKALKTIAYSVLYQNVTLARPSSLLQFKQTLLAQPSLRKLVTSLHIGPTSSLKEEVPAGAWPYFCKNEGGELTPEGEPLLWIWSTLKEEELPRWCGVRRVWTWDRPEPCCQGQFVFDAFETAFKTLDVEPYRRGYGQSGRYIGVDAWALRLLQVEAVLSLYLREMKRIEEEKHYPVKHHSELLPQWPVQHPTDCSGLRCQHYPQLAIVTDLDERVAPMMRDGRPLKIFKLTRQQLLRHIGRPGAFGDQFNHPVIFARERHKGEINPYGRARLEADLGGNYPDHFHGPPPPDDENEPGISPVDEAPSPAELAASDEPELQTSDSLVHLTALVLSMVAPQIINLSLSGCLWLALCVDVLPKLTFKNLTCLSLGPILRYWDNDLFKSSGAAMPALEYVRLSTRSVSAPEVEALAGRSKALRHVKRVDLELIRLEKPIEKLAASPKSICKIVCSLQGLPAPPSVDDEDEDGAPAKPASSSKEMVGSARFIQVLLHTTTQDDVLDLAPSTSIRSAWEEGRPLLPTEIPPEASIPVNEMYVTRSKASHHPPILEKYSIKEQYEEALEWWEEYAVKGKVPKRGYLEPEHPAIAKAKALHETLEKSGKMREGGSFMMALLKGEREGEAVVYEL